VAALLVAVALLWGPARRLVSRPAASPPEAVEPAAIAAMSGPEALQAGLALGRAGRDPESLPYFQHAIRQGQGDLWQVRYNYATALYNTTLRIETRGGLPVQATRSSWERVALVHEAVRQLDQAEGQARTPPERATVRAAYAQMHLLWGLPWDAFLAYRQASAADPANRGLAARADGLLGAIRAPSGPGATATR